MPSAPLSAISNLWPKLEAIASRLQAKVGLYIAYHATLREPNSTETAQAWQVLMMTVSVIHV